MAFVRLKERQIDLSLVYYGPPGAGKRTSLEWIHGRILASRRSELFVERRESFEKVFFFLYGTAHKGFDVRYRVGAATGDFPFFFFEEHRALFKWVDGVVFVGDARPERRTANETYWNRMMRILADYGIAPDSNLESTRLLPLAVQWNRVDGPRSLLPDTVFRPRGKRTGLSPFQLVPTVADRGRSVFLPFRNCVRHMMRNLYRNIGR